MAQMKFLSILLPLILIAGARPVYAGNDKFQDSLFVQYMAGVYLLKNTTWITEKQKAQRYEELVHITGFSADSAKNIIAKYYNKPESWKKIQARIQNVYVEYENKVKNDTINTTKSSERSK